MLLYQCPIVLFGCFSSLPKNKTTFLKAKPNISENHFILQIPAWYFSMQNTNVDWNYNVEESKTYCRGFQHGCHWPRGKMLGGSHGINAMVYFRGNPADYNNWAEMGNPTWDWDSVLKYFKKSESNQNSSFVNYKSGKFHGTDGPISIDAYQSEDDSRQLILDAAHELGYQFLDDLNADKFIGFGDIQGTLKNGERYSTAKAYLIPAKDRKNLHIIKHAHVTRIIIDDYNRATGVEFVYKNVHKMQAFATHEVVLSAGAINTPQLLMLSGIGPADHLNQLKIPVKQNLAVGKNLQDHIIVPLILSIAGLNAEESLTAVADEFYNYLMHRTGPLAGIGVVSLLGLINTVNKTGYPDIELQYFNFKSKSMKLEVTLKEHIQFKDNIVNTIMAKNAKSEISILYVELLRPDSTGEILLKNVNPFEKPEILPNYLSDKRDVDTLLRGIKFQEKLLATSAFRKFGVELIRLPLDECDQFEYASNEYWKCYMSYMSSTVYHPMGTAKMGPSTDQHAVVDSELKVFGLNGLRVIDASVMPKMVSANINAATIMIAEKGADFIKATWSGSARKDDL